VATAATALGINARGQEASRLQPVSFMGRNYARASAYARSAGLSFKWTSPELATLTGPGVSILLDHDSRKIRINNIWVWLSAPVWLRDREAFIPLLDISKTVEPILSQRRSRQALRTICLDPGHGGEDTGKRDGNRNEKQYTLLLARDVGRLLGRAGFRVTYTRTSDRPVELSDRPLIAQRHKADLFLSLHYNGADVSSAFGAEVYCMTPAGTSSTNAGGEGADSPAYPGNRMDERNILLAYELQKLMVARLGRTDRGVRRARFAVLRDATMPAALIEAGFMSNPQEARWIYSSKDRALLAQAIVDAVRNFKKAISL